MPFNINDRSYDVHTYTELIWHLLWPSHRSTLDSPNDGPPKLKLTELIDPPPRLFALIIGIDKYLSPDIDDLSGSVSDSKDMENYLKDSLKVPADQIHTIHNEEATRSAIINAFNDLRDDTQIKIGDAIVIYYAGHGCSTTAPAGWDAEGNKTQFIFPCDGNTTDQDGELIHGIPDRTIASLLSKLAKAKGDNISVFFDCCHSGSGTRTTKFEPKRMARVAKVNDNVPADLDRHIWQSHHEGDRGASIASGFAQIGLRSHVLLAACGADETSYEVDGHGIFTTALLTTLKTIGADKMTYRSVLERMPALIGKQNPQCEGVHQDRFLFNAMAPSLGRVFYEVFFKDGKFIMDAGAVHGITDSAEFTIYDNEESPITSSPLGILGAEQVKALSTTLTPLSESHATISFTDKAYAVQTKAGEREDLRLHVAMDDRLLWVFQILAQQMQHPGFNTRRIQLVGLDENPHLQIDIEEGMVVFKNLDPLVTKYGLTRLPHIMNNNIEDIYPVIRAAAHFRWHVDLANLDPSHSLQSGVELHCYKIIDMDDYDDDLNPVYKPVGDNLNVAGEVHISEDRMIKYGFKIINNTSSSLYPSLFYFDNSTFEIAGFYLPPSAGRFKLDPPLRPHSSLTIGYGSGGLPPQRFNLPDGADVDVGFLKLFLTAEYVNYSHIPQLSPFHNHHGPSRDDQIERIETWDTIKVALIQKRGLVNSMIT